MPRSGAPGKYAPLTVWLQALPARQEEAVLTFAEIETIIGAPLPLGAWTSTFWVKADAARTNWGRAGFRARLIHHTKSVRFTRMQRSPRTEDERCRAPQSTRHFPPGWQHARPIKRMRR
jgi:hypothetical protein